MRRRNEPWRWRMCKEWKKMEKKKKIVLTSWTPSFRFSLSSSISTSSMIEVLSQHSSDWEETFPRNRILSQVWELLLTFVFLIKVNEIKSIKLIQSVTDFPSPIWRVAGSNFIIRHTNQVVSFSITSCYLSGLLFNLLPILLCPQTRVNHVCNWDLI